jgi:bifunctional DNA-binding transcriptional regulator/antitoxin component of YhaV-PrlF toxin-antitoxin module
LGLTIEAKVGKKYALYLPKAVVGALNLKVGDRVLLKVSGKALVVESLQDPIQLALEGKKFASITADQVEAISLEEQQEKDDGESSP